MAKAEGQRSENLKPESSKQKLKDIKYLKSLLWATTNWMLAIVDATCQWWIGWRFNILAGGTRYTQCAEVWVMIQLYFLKCKYCIVIQVGWLFKLWKPAFSVISLMSDEFFLLLFYYYNFFLLGLLVWYQNSSHP